MTEKKNLFRLIALAFAVILLLLYNSVLSVAFADSVEDFHTRDVLSDLVDSNVIKSDKTDFTEEYEENNKSSLAQDLTMVYLVEYCYGREDVYGLYAYIYKKNLEKDDFSILTESSFNSVLMAVQFDSNGNADDYEKFPLTYCNQQSLDFGVFYKFKIERTSKNGTDILDVVSPIQRIYVIGGVELKTENKIKDFAVEKRWLYRGEAAGIGNTDNNTLKADVEHMPTISLDVKQTYYRSAEHDNYVYDQISSVYFTIPNEYLDNYGTLKRIKAEWYEYKTSPIVVTSNAGFYNWFVNNNLAGTYYERQSASSDSYGLDWGVRFDRPAGSTIYLVEHSYGAQHSFLYPYAETDSVCYWLSWIFPFGDLKGTEFDVYSPYVSNHIGNISSSLVEEYMKNPLFAACTTGDTFVASDGNEYPFPDKLFLSEIDNDRQGINNSHGSIGRGYSYYDFDIDEDIGNVLTYNPDNASFSELIDKYGFWKALFGKKDVETKEYAPFVQVNYDHIKDMPSKDVVDNYLVNVDDVEKIKEASNKVNETLYLFRFANTDYYSSPAYIWKFPIIEEGGGSYVNQAYVCQQTVFLNFDILQLTFKSDSGQLTMIPVVSDPINIIGDLTPPTVKDGTDLSALERLFALLLGLIVLIVVIWLLSKLFPPLFTVALSVVGVPFKFIKNIFKRRK